MTLSYANYGLTDRGSTYIEIVVLIFMGGLRGLKYDLKEIINILCTLFINDKEGYVLFG